MDRGVPVRDGVKRQPSDLSWSSDFGIEVFAHSLELGEDWTSPWRRELTEA